MALTLIQAGLRSAQAAKQLGLGRSTLYRELASLRAQAPSALTLDPTEPHPAPLQAPLEDR